MAKRKPKPWHLSQMQREAIRKMTRDELESFAISQQEQIQRFLRAAIKLGHAIAELQTLDI